MLIDRRFIGHFDWRLFFTALSLALLGVFAIYSATGAAVFRKPYYLRQLLWLVISLLGMLIVLGFHPRTIRRFAYLLYGICLFSLVLVLVIGQIGMGAQRWIKLGFFTFQPSELAKISLVLFLARYFSDHKEEVKDSKTFLTPALFILLPMILVLKQPDLGTTVLLFFIGVAMMFLVGLKPLYLLPVGVAGLLVSPLLWGMLKDYQRQRLLVFFNPDLDPLGVGYHIAQSKIAVGSGRLLGKGFLSAPQSQLHFLPESHTDFIFAVLAEQWGFIGSFLLLLLYTYLISRGLQIARDAEDPFASLMSFGLTAMLTSQVLINLGMVIGILPVVGVTLPLLSYG
ncbi:MAG: rod shape-determining protein RodA, partial [candidate division NC10 bacterium]|nr:rod shape-determining protein RodA [candidate division NC10 bacterium]